MKLPLIGVGMLLVGGGVGFLLAQTTEGDDARASATRTTTTEIETLRRERVEDRRRIEELEAEIARLKAALAAAQKGEDDNPWPDDTPEAVEKLLADAYADNNVDWLLEAIERLLRMGEDGYPLLKRMLEDIIWRRRFMPAQSEFRTAHVYRFARIFANQERQFIGFLDYLLKDPNAHPYFRQGAMMGAAFYVGSKAPGSKELQETMMQLFLEQSGVEVPGMIPGGIGKRMQVFAMAMSGDPKMIGPLRDEYRSTNDKELQSNILGALAYLGDDQALPMIEERLDPTQGDHREEIRALGRLDSSESHEAATNFLRAIPDSKRFYQHAGSYVRNGGGASAVLLIRERVQAKPGDPEVGSAIGTLRRYPTQESLDTLNLIAQTSTDDKIQKRATEAADDVSRVLRGEIPEPGEND